MSRARRYRYERSRWTVGRAMGIGFGIGLGLLALFGIIVLVAGGFFGLLLVGASAS